MSIRVVEIDSFTFTIEEVLKKLAKEGLLVIEKRGDLFYCAGRGVNKKTLKAWVVKREKA